MMAQCYPVIHFGQILFPLLFFLGHSSSESSESEQNIESEDDGGCTVDLSEVDQDILREVMLFRLQRHSVEIRMKRLKRALHTYTAKEAVLQRKIKKIKDAMSEAWIELSSVPVSIGIL